MKTEELRYLQRLAELYPTIGKASTEIINLQSILNLPKGTEHFLSDIHGEYEAFSHVLRNGSGAVRKKIDDVFGHTLSNSDKRSLATLVYYPKEKIAYVKKKESDMQNWYKITLYRLIEVCKTTASKYTRSKVRKALPSDYAYVIEELITEKAEVLDKEAYYDSIVDTIIDIGRAENFIIALAELIQRLVVDHLHVLGDIYDRGPGPHFIMDRLMDYHSLDIQWGNHDVVWMGAAAGMSAIWLAFFCQKMHGTYEMFSIQDTRSIIVAKARLAAVILKVGFLQITPSSLTSSTSGSFLSIPVHNLKLSQITNVIV